MTATIGNKNRFSALPKNKTGLFAADTLSDVKSSRHYFMNIPSLSPQYRANGSINNVLASSEQTHHQIRQYLSSNQEIQQYYPLETNSTPAANNTLNSSRTHQNRIRNGFSSAKVRHPNFRFLSATAQRTSQTNEKPNTPRKKSLASSQGLVKLKSEIDHMNDQLKRHNELSKIPKSADQRELDPTIHSALSFATSCRLSSASTIRRPDRFRQRFTSAITQVIGNNTTEVLELPEQPIIQPAHIVPTTPAITLNENAPQPLDNEETRPTHAYQIPQQSNVGSETIFTSAATASRISSTSTVPQRRSAKSGQNRFSAKVRSPACPFYVMYLANLTVQQQRTVKDAPLNEIQTASFVSQSLPRKVPVNSRTSTSNVAQGASKRAVNSPLSTNTISTLDEDDFLTNTSFSTLHKRPTARVLPIDRENPALLNDILRTSAWNHIRV